MNIALDRPRARTILYVCVCFGHAVPFMILRSFVHNGSDSSRVCDFGLFVFHNIYSVFLQKLFISIFYCPLHVFPQLFIHTYFDEIPFLLNSLLCCYLRLGFPLYYHSLVFLGLWCIDSCKTYA